MITWEAIFFWFLAFGAVASSIAVVWLRTPLYSAIALIVDFLFFAGLYVMLSAHFMAVIQVLVYGGAIMVLFMFIIMLLNLRSAPEEVEFKMQHILAALGTLGLLIFMVTGILKLGDGEAVAAARAAAQENAPVATASSVPGLYLDLSEDALQERFEKKIVQPVATDKFQSFPGAKHEVPTLLRGGEVNRRDVPPPSFGTVEPLSLLLANRFVVPFELTALLLLAAVIGAVVIAKKRL